MVATTTCTIISIIAEKCNYIMHRQLFTSAYWHTFAGPNQNKKPVPTTRPPEQLATKIWSFSFSSPTWSFDWLIAHHRGIAAKWNKPRLHSKPMAFHPLSICCLVLVKRGARLHGFNSNVSLLLSSASQATSRLPPRSLFIVWRKRHGMEILSNTPSCRPHRVKAPSLPQQSLLSVKEG